MIARKSGEGHRCDDLGIGEVLVFIKIDHLTVNRVLDFHDDYRAIPSATINHVFLNVPKPARPRTDRSAT